MVLSEIHRFKDAFKEDLRSRNSYGDLYVYESIETFQREWNDDMPDFGSMYDHALQNSITQILWRDRYWTPKRTMGEFIKRDPDLIRAMFKELLNEKLEIEGRIDRFVWHCDQIRDDLLRIHTKYQKHDHEGFRMISTYLALKYPEDYAIYDYEPYKNFMIQVRAIKVPEPHEIARFFKVMRSVWKIISKDEELVALDLKRRKGNPRLWQGTSLTLASEFVAYVSTQHS